MMQLDELDKKATSAFEGYVVRKDLVRTFSRQFPVPTYVVEFLLGRYCATTDEAESRRAWISFNVSWRLGLSRREKRSSSKPGPESLAPSKS